jgi:alpha-D-ribose 1-methylphosphonate 5-triphosphate synthase subunit PhnL
MSQTILKIESLCKSFTLHAQGGVTLPVLSDVSLQLEAGECVVLEGPSGMGKSTLLKLIYATYRATAGTIHLRRADGAWMDVACADEPELLAMRSRDVGYVSQFLRVIPRVAALDVVAESLLDDLPLDEAARAKARTDARAEAGRWLARLRIPESLWGLPPATFSGGEQQRINIARSLIRPRPLMLLDEPTASLDPANVDTVVTLIQELRERGCAVLGIFHDPTVRDRVATRRITMNQLRSLA